MSEPQKHTPLPTSVIALREALASSRDLVARSRKLLDDLNDVREQSWKAIGESHIALNKAKRLTNR